MITGGVALPFELTKIQYYHRILNRNILVESGYFRKGNKDDTLHKTFTIEKVSDKDFRLAKDTDYMSMYELYNKKSVNYNLYEEMSFEQFCWVLKTRENVMYVIVEEVDGKVVSFGSFYIINSLNICENKEVKNAYLYYYATKNEVKMLKELFKLASDLNCAMFNVLNTYEDKEFFDDVMLQPGDGFLKYYLYNWETTPIKHNEVLFMLP